MKLSILKLTLTAALLLGFFGCVGAIKEDKDDVSVDDSSLIADPTFSFQGIVSGEAASDSMITLHFPPAVLLDASEVDEQEAPEGSTHVNFTYKITRDGSEDPIANFVDANLSVNPEGNYMVSVATDGRGDCGTYNVTATKADSLEARSGSNFFRICSKDEFYPVFEGVFSTTPLSGCDLYTGVTLNWRVAEKSPELVEEIDRYNDLKTENLTKFSQGEIDSTTFLANSAIYDAALATLNEYAPDTYLIFYETSEEALLTKLNEENPTANNTVVNANDTSISISGLTTGETYYFAMRSATSLITATSQKNIERNVEILAYDVPQVQTINFSGITSVDIPQNVDGYNSATVRYTTCEGCDTYYYYALDNADPTNPLIINIDDDTPTAIIDLNSTPINPSSYTLTGLAKHTQYRFYVVGINACGAAGSPEVAGQSLYQLERTTPPIAPFNGITDIETAGGSLDRLEISWDLPNDTNGVYDLYAVYLTDSDGNEIAQLTNTPEATDPYIEPTDNISIASIQSITILNVDAGENASNPNEYCFTVAPKESDFNGPGGVGREMPLADRQIVCKNFYYQAPTFAGPYPGTCNSTSSTFEVSYPIPDDGTYSQFRLFYKIDEGETELDYDLAEADTNGLVVLGKGVGTTFTRIEFDYDPLATPSVATPAFAGPVSSNPFTITGLEPDTNYVFAMETYFDPDGAGAAPPYFVRPVVLRSCRTEKPDVVHEGWDHIMALGVKTNGLDSGSKIREKISSSTKASLNTLQSGLASDQDRLEWWFMEEDPTAPPTEGYVFFSWFDFKFSGLGTYANSLANNGSTIEYIIYRSLNDDMTGASEIGSIAVTEDVYLYHFIDEDIPFGSKKYYYQVKLRIDGIDLVFASINPIDNEINEANAILEVIIPPPNMSFVHRYMFNKHQCTRINTALFHGGHVFDDLSDNGEMDYSVTTGYEKRGARGSYFNAPSDKNYDISNNYRCLYNGVGAYWDPAEEDYYFDIGKSFLVDRFESGAKIGTASNTDNHCIGDGNGPYDCIGTFYVSTEIGAAPKDTIYYELGSNHATLTYSRAYYNDLWINKSPDGNPQNIWEKVDYLELSTFSNLSDKIFSNEAYLPPAKLEDPELRKRFCTDRSITIGANTYSGRLGSRQEFIVMGGWNEQQSPLDIKQIAQRVDYTGDKTQFGCNTEEARDTRVPYQPVFGTPSNLNENNYPSLARSDEDLATGRHEYFPHFLRTGSYSNNAA